MGMRIKLKLGNYNKESQELTAGGDPSQQFPFHLNTGLRPVFTAQCYASAVLATGLCPSVSVTSRSSTKTAKRRIIQTTPHDSPGTLVF